MFTIDPATSFDSQLFLKLGLLVIAIVIAVLQARKGETPAKGIGRVVLVFTIAGLSLTFLDQVLDTQEEVERSRKTLDAIQRSLERIEKVRASVEVVVDSEHPKLRHYRDRIRESGCLRQPASLREMKGPEGRPIPRDFHVEEECFPDPVEESFASKTLGFLVIDLRLFRSGGSPCTDEGLDKTNADMSIPLRASIADGSLQIIYDQLDRAFVLRAQKLESDFLTFDGNGRLAAVGDLAGARMVFDVQAVSLNRGESDALSKSTRLGRIRLRFAGSRSYSVDSSQDLFQERRPDFLVRYLYCFPGDLRPHPG